MTCRSSPSAAHVRNATSRASTGRTQWTRANSSGRPTRNHRSSTIGRAEREAFGYWTALARMRAREAALLPHHHTMGTRCLPSMCCASASAAARGRDADASYPGAARISPAFPFDRLAPAEPERAGWHHHDSSVNTTARDIFGQRRFMRIAKKTIRGGAAVSGLEPAAMYSAAAYRAGLTTIGPKSSSMASGSMPGLSTAQ